MFKQLAPDISVVGCGCLGHCGSGPVALVLPEQVWYDHVQPAMIMDIVSTPQGTLRLAKS